MPEIAKDTPTREITIAGLNVDVPTPYREGDVLKAAEADQVNQVWCENIRNNMAKDVAAAREDGKADGEIVRMVLEYTNQYEFGQRRGGAFRAVDPITAEAMRIAKGLIREALRKKDPRKLRDIPASEITDRAKQAIEKHPQIVEKAKANVKSAQALEKDILGAID